MVCEPVSTYHEYPGQRLRELTTLIAQTRGSPIAMFGAADLLVRDAYGGHLRILQADQTAYLHPRATGPGDLGGQRRATRHGAGGGQHHQRPLRQARYESWGFPEVWEEVPNAPSPSRPAALRRWG